MSNQLLEPVSLIYQKQYTGSSSPQSNKLNYLQILYNTYKMTSQCICDRNQSQH